MTVKVLVVDDSGFFRRRVSKILGQDPSLEVIATAVNGRDAVDQVLRLRPDVVTMDIEMPLMDGISAVREIMRRCPTPILMFSSLTHQGAQATLDALEAGALDFLPKQFEDIALDRQEAGSVLRQRVKALARRRLPRLRTVDPVAPAKSRSEPFPRLATQRAPAPLTPGVGARSGKRYQALAIGTSTGGPVALQSILTRLPAGFAHPIVLVQHMPAAFTPAFAARLDSLSQIQVKEAEDGELLRPGTAYLAPGGQQMLLEGRPAGARLRVAPGPAQFNYKPCVDLTFGSLCKVYQGQVLAVILTGMGADGKDGCRLLKEAGATIWAQDEQSCVVYGMPQAVVKAGIADAVLPLEQFAGRIVVEMS